MFNRYLLKVFSVISDLIHVPTTLLPLKAMVSYISHTHNFEPNISAKDAAYTQVYTVVSILHVCMYVSCRSPKLSEPIRKLETQ